MLTIKVTGEEKLQKLIRELGKAFTAQQATADLMVAVQPMADAARAGVSLGPESIHLRDNIGAAPLEGKAAVAVGAFHTPPIGEIFYGRFLELGTVKQSARPWLRPAFDSTREGVIERIVSLLVGRITAAVGK